MVEPKSVCVCVRAHMYIYIYMYVHTSVYVCVYIYIYVYSCVYRYISIYMCTYKHACIQIAALEKTARTPPPTRCQTPRIRADGLVKMRLHEAGAVTLTEDAPKSPVVVRALSSNTIRGTYCYFGILPLNTCKYHTWYGFQEQEVHIFREW